MIPSLNGGLYKFNGETVEPIPLTADHLLQASFRYSDDLVISGWSGFLPLTLGNINFIRRGIGKLFLGTQTRSEIFLFLWVLLVWVY